MGRLRHRSALLLLGLSFACAPEAPPAAPHAGSPQSNGPAAAKPTIEEPARSVEHTEPAGALTGTPAPSTPPALAFPAFQLERTLVREVSSELTGKRHQLLIRVPESFAKEPERRYPVLLVLDGQWDFPLVVSVTDGLRYDRVTPEMVIVGLDYAGAAPDYQALRSHDYVPTRARNRAGKEVGGGAANFLQWLETAVLPLLEQDYRADPERRILAGASFGGLFALYTLFEKPELFWGYIAISPAVGWDARYIFRREQEFHALHPNLERRVWLSSGTQEWPDYLREERAFFKQFSARRYRGLSLAIRELEGERHGGVKPEAYNRAVRFLSEPLVVKPEQ